MNLLFITIYLSFAFDPMLLICTVASISPLFFLLLLLSHLTYPLNVFTLYHCSLFLVPKASQVHPSSKGVKKNISSNSFLKFF